MMIFRTGVASILVLAFEIVREHVEDNVLQRR